MKAEISELALFGGTKVFDEPLHVGRPNIGDKAKVLELIGRALDEKWLTNNGPLIRAFEQQVARIQKVKHCIAIANGTVALEIASRALGFEGEVIVPSFTFVATAHALQWQEITPVFCDIALDDFNIDPARVEELITPRTTAIVGVHVWGRPCKIDPLQEIAERHGLRLLFDASHAFGCSYRGQPVGSFGDAEVFSFHATKFINSFEGGAITTDDDEVAEKCRLMRNFGFSGIDEVNYIGTNGKMSEPCAAMGLTSLEAMEGFIECNRHNFQHYREKVNGVKGLKVLDFNNDEQNNFQYVTILVDSNETGITRDELVTLLTAENLLARRYFYPGCHLMEPYKSYFPHASLLLPKTEAANEMVLCLPTGTALDRDTITSIAALLEFIVENSAEITAKMRDAQLR